MVQSNDDLAKSLIGEICRESRLSRAELARRAGLQRSVLSAYEHGRRQPSVAALARIAGAAGLEVRVSPVADCQALAHAGGVLAQVLDLAEMLPSPPRRELAYPPLIRLTT